MNGQWLGRYSGTNSGLLVIDVDDMETHYEGRVCAYDDNSSLPGTFAFVKTRDKGSTSRLCFDLYPINPRTGDVATWDQLAAMFPPGVNVPRRAEVNLSWSGQTLSVSWLTDIGTSGAAEIPKSRAGGPTEYHPLSEVADWEQFKAFVNRLEHRRYLFREQREPLRLRTSFHRTRRADLHRFLNEDIKTLHRHLSQRTSHVFDLNIPDQNGAFFNLVQHHGYPTPLLDWTYSPYVGAFFAYRHVKNSEAAMAREDEKVRIFIFDQKQWKNDWPQLSKLTPCRPHFSILEFIAIENERLIPQQSVSSVTNIDDIETYIRSMQSPEKNYLQIIDLPLRERVSVIRELSVMGITAGSLLPGLDGACEELRERFFSL
jgi:FRG domain